MVFRQQRNGVFHLIRLIVRGHSRIDIDQQVICRRLGDKVEQHRRRMVRGLHIIHHGAQSGFLVQIADDFHARFAQRRPDGLGIRIAGKKPVETSPSSRMTSKT